MNKASAAHHYRQRLFIYFVRAKSVLDTASGLTNKTAMSPQKPELSVDIRLTDSMVDLVEGGIT